MDIKNIIKSNGFKIAIYIVGGFLILLFVFQAGMYVGFKKAAFSNTIGENYFREMGGKGDDSMFDEMRGNDFINAHGAIGQIVEIKLPLIVVEDHDTIDKVIRISTSTVIKDLNGTENSSDLKVNDLVTVFGSGPDENSVIDARLVRIMPAPENPFISTSTAK